MTTYWGPKTAINAANLSELTTVYDTQSCPKGLIQYIFNSDPISLTGSEDSASAAEQRQIILSLDPQVYNGRIWVLGLNYKSIWGNCILETWANNSRCSEIYLYSTTTYNSTKHLRLCTATVKKLFKPQTAGENIDQGKLVVGTSYSFTLTVRPASGFTDQDIIFATTDTEPIEFYLEDIGT